MSRESPTLHQRHLMVKIREWIQMALDQLHKSPDAAGRNLELAMAATKALDEDYKLESKYS